MTGRFDGDGGPAEHTDVGAYALGLLEAGDRRAFEAHLTGCARCADELAGLSGMRDLLTGLRADGAVDPPPESARTGDLGRLLRRRRAAARRRRRGTAIAGVAAGVVLLAGGAAAGATLTGDRGDGAVPADLLGWGDTWRGADARTGVSGIVAVEGKGWGTHLALDLSHLTGPRTCRLVAVSTTGARHVVTEWRVPPGTPDPLQVHGGTALRRPELGRLEVRDQDGTTLLTIPL
jgi:hypothetical protein